MTELNAVDQAPARERGMVAHVISLVVGIPSTVVMLLVSIEGFFGGLYALVFAAMSALGCALAVIGMNARPRRFRWQSLLLTLIPGTVIAFYVAVLISLTILLGGGNPNS